ncbi:hypothetical protein CMUST_12140 [Corynebacterium mustelae]|uniref:Bacterial PH domain n=1 Tax=Corynebacterium mustelae TaxID=571915 RepID=A0A0G3H007_9CORY|nr:hypothetical protein [Corynebacterium mustelae]AKK06739.1 hypothetical protein CMUST_12140 [Corynebacterium mustelae]
MKKLRLPLITAGLLITVEWWLVHVEALSAHIAIVCFICLECGLGLWAYARDPNHIAFRYWRAEWQMLKTITYLLRRHIIIPPDAVPITGAGNWWQIPCAMTAATALEILALELLLDNRLIRILLIVVSGYSVLILWAIFGSKKTHPHYLSETSLVLRHNREIIAEIPLKQITKIQKSRNFNAHNYDITADTLVLGSNEGTNVAVQLNQPTLVVRPHYPWQEPQSALATSIHIWVDSDSADICSMF